MEHLRPCHATRTGALRPRCPGGGWTAQDGGRRLRERRAGSRGEPRRDYGRARYGVCGRSSDAPRKIAMIGAGSVVFCKTLRQRHPGHARAARQRVRADVPDRAEAAADGGVRPADDRGQRRCRRKVWATTDRREAIRDADFVVVMIQVGGVDAFELDYKIPLKYGVDQCIGDTLGPGGVFRGAAHDSACWSTSRATWRRSPSRAPSCCSTPTRWRPTAWRSGTSAECRSSGLCHGVQTTLDLIAGYCGVPKNEITYTCGGINHMDWFLRLEHEGRDLYPELREMFERPEYYKNEKVRGEVFRHFGYFMTESHRPPERIRAVVPQEQGGARPLLRRAELRRRERRLLHVVPDGGGQVRDARPAAVRVDTACDRRSVEYCSWIMEAVATGRPFRFMGNVAQRRLHRQPAAGLLRRGADVRRRHGTAPDIRRRAAAAVRRAVHDQRQRADADRRGGPDRRSGAHRAGGWRSTR